MHLIKVYWYQPHPWLDRVAQQKHTATVLDTIGYKFWNSKVAQIVKKYNVAQQIIANGGVRLATYIVTTLYPHSSHALPISFPRSGVTSIKLRKNLFKNNVFLSFYGNSTGFWKRIFFEAGYDFFVQDMDQSKTKPSVFLIEYLNQGHLVTSQMHDF